MLQLLNDVIRQLKDLPGFSLVMKESEVALSLGFKRFEYTSLTLPTVNTSQHTKYQKVILKEKIKTRQKTASIDLLGCRVHLAFIVQTRLYSDAFCQRSLYQVAISLVIFCRNDSVLQLLLKLC